MMSMLMLKLLWRVTRGNTLYIYKYMYDTANIYE